MAVVARAGDHGVGHDQIERAQCGRGRQVLARALLAAPIVMFLAAGWWRRFFVDDAFINFRVVHQVVAGNGPVYNVGERVEATTSTLWAVVLVGADLLSPIDLERTALVLVLALGAFGIAAGMAGAADLARLVEAGGGGPTSGRLWVPVGALAYLGVAATWDWATGGLENGLGLAWLGATFWSVVRLASPEPAPPSRRRLLATAFLVGLGVLVRPDFAAYVPGLGLPVAVVAWRRGRGRGLAAAVTAALALPLAVQVLRMGYYGRLFPNTVYAKEGTSTWWGQGLRYLGNFVGTYWLMFPAALVGVLVAAWWRDTGGDAASRRAWRLVVGGLLASVALHVIGIVRVGGDYMHARLLLSDWFGLLLPVFCVPLPAWPQLVRRAPRLRGLVPLALVAWALAAAVVARPPLGEFRRVRLMETGQIELQAAGIVDGRRHTLSLATSSHPVSAYDELLWQPALVPGHYADGATAPVLGRLPGRSVVGAFALGRVGYRLPLDVWVYDRHGLADPVVAHVGTEERGVPGHEKALSPTWVAAEWVDPSVEVDPATFAVVPGLTSWLLSVPVGAPTDAAGFDAEREAAAAALGCGKLDDVRDSARQPLTPSRFFGNLVDAVRLDGFRFPADPVAAQAALC